MSTAVQRFSPASFPAAVVRSQTAGELVLTETRYGGGASLELHAHEYACVVVVMEGRFHERFEKHERFGEPGMVIMRPCGEPHADSFDANGGRCLNVELPPRWLARMREASAAVDSAAYRGGAFATLGRKLWDELAHPDDVSPLAVESLVLSLLVEGMRERRRGGTSAPRWLLQVRARLHDEPASRLTLDDLACEAGVHPVHLAKAFRRWFGEPPAAYVRRLRIEHACRTLADGDDSIADIAAAAGFSDQSHFGRTFRRLLGVTPGQYRASRVPSR